MKIINKSNNHKISFNHILKMIKLFFMQSIKNVQEIIFSFLYPLVWLVIMYFSYQNIPNFFNSYFGTWILGSSMILGLLKFGRSIAADYFNNRFFLQKIFGYKKSEYFIGVLIYYFVYLTIIYYIQILLVATAFKVSISVKFIFLNWLNNLSVVIIFSFYALSFVKIISYFRNYNFFLNMSYSSFILLSGYSIPYFLFNGSTNFTTKGWYNYFQAMIPLGSNIQLSIYTTDPVLANYVLAITNGWYLPFIFLFLHLIAFVIIFFTNNFLKIGN